MDNKHDILILNGLITTSLDSMKGFEDAAEDASSTRFAQMFADFARDRAQIVSTLQAEVRTLGGEPDASTSFLGTAHRGFMNLKQALVGQNDKAIINEVERGEDHIKVKFEAAQNDADLQPATLAVIREAFISVKAGHDQARALKLNMA